MTKPDYEITLDQQQLSRAVGNYCADVLKALPIGVYPKSQLSVITKPEQGEVTVVFRAWGPPGPVGHMPSGAAVYAGDGHPAVRNTDPARTPGMLTSTVGQVVPARYEPTEEVDEP